LILLLFIYTVQESETSTMEQVMEHKLDDDPDDNEVGDDTGISMELLRHGTKFDPQNPTLLANPSLFSETYAMSLAAAAIFSFADVRRAARNGKINAPEATGLPLPVSTALQVYSDHREVLQKIMKKADTNFLNTMLQYLQNNETVEGFLIPKVLNEAMIHYFGDEDTNSECVYLLLESPQLSRIVLCFRGSITMNDWIKDSKVVVGYIKNPLFMRPNQPQRLGVHLGFREYLYDESRSVSLNLSLVTQKMKVVKKAARELPQKMTSLLISTSPSDNESQAVSANKDMERTASAIFLNNGTDQETPEMTITATKNNNQTVVPPRTDPDIKTSGNDIKTSRLTQILNEVGSLRSKHEEYRIYVTGHSLGGALAMLTALEVAALWGSTNNPVTFIGIGNPRAATYSFRNAVEILEREGKMRCLVVHNHLDIVPMIPTSALHVRTKNTFCQLGFQMLLYPDKFEMRYCPHMNNSYQDFKDQFERMTLAIFRPDKIGGRHHYLTYLTRLRDLEDPLSRLHLNNYYNNFVDSNPTTGSEKIWALSPTHVTIRQQRFSLFGNR
jgi:hypothetical protein